MRVATICLSLILLVQCRTAQTLDSGLQPAKEQTKTSLREEIKSTGVNVEGFPSSAKALELVQEQAKSISVDPKQPGAQDFRALLKGLAELTPGKIDGMRAKHDCSRALEVFYDSYKNQEKSINLALSEGSEERAAANRVDVGARALFYSNLQARTFSGALLASAGGKLVGNPRDPNSVKSAKKDLIWANTLNAGTAALYGVILGGASGLAVHHLYSESKLSSAGVGALVGVVTAGLMFTYYGAATAHITNQLNLADVEPHLKDLTPEQKLEALSLGVFASCSLEEI